VTTVTFAQEEEEQQEKFAQVYSIFLTRSQQHNSHTLALLSCAVLSYTVCCLDRNNLLKDFIVTKSSTLKSFSRIPSTNCESFSSPNELFPHPSLPPLLRPNWWPRPPDVSDLHAVENLLNSFLVFRLLTRTAAEESEGKLAVALSFSRRTSSRNTKRSSSSHPETSTGTAVATATASLSSGKTVEGTLTRNGKTQQPADYKAWLFTDDWYTHTHSVIDRPAGLGSSSCSQKLSTQQSPRHLISSQSDSGINSSREGGGGGAKTPRTTTAAGSLNKSPTKYHKPPKAHLSRKPSTGLNSSTMDSASKAGDSHSMFQDEVYDLMSKDRSDASVESDHQQQQQLQQQSGMLSSTLTDEEEEDILSLGEMRSQQDEQKSSLQREGG
jgi:hypothetical protein